MKKQFAVALLTLSLFACNDDDDKKDNVETPSPIDEVTLPVEEEIIVDPIIEPVEPVEPITKRDVTISFDADYVFTPPNGDRNVAYPEQGEAIDKFDDNYGIQHSVRTDSYVLTISDKIGVRHFTDISIVGDTPLTFEVDGDAEFVLTHIVLDADANGIVDSEEDTSIGNITSSYFTAAGQTEIAVENETVLMTVSNQHYAMVNLEKSAEQDIQMTINGNEPATSDTGLYNYITGGDASIQAIGNGIIHTEEFSNLLPATLYKVGPKPGEENFTIYVNWSYPITPYTGPGVVNPNQIIGADNVTVDEISGAVSGTTAGKGVTVYQPTGGYSLNEYKNFDVDVDFLDGYENKLIVNIYLEYNGDKVRANFYPKRGERGTVYIGEDTFTGGDFDSSFEEFASSEKYKDYIVTNSFDSYLDNPVNGVDLQHVRGNFFLRIGQSSYAGSGDEFTITKWSLAQPSGLPLNQVRNAVNLRSSSGVVYGEYEAGKPAIAYETVEADTLLSEYTWDFDIKVFNLADEEINKNFVNIYLIDNGIEVKAVFRPYEEGEQQYEIIRDDVAEFQYLTEAEFKEQYANATVRQWAELTGFIDGFIGNFVWRSSGSESVIDGKFEIHSFEVTKN